MDQNTQGADERKGGREGGKGYSLIEALARAIVHSDSGQIESLAMDQNTQGADDHASREDDAEAQDALDRKTRLLDDQAADEGATGGHRDHDRTCKEENLV